MRRSLIALMSAERLQVQCEEQAMGKPDVPRGVVKGQRLIQDFMNGRADSGSHPLVLKRKREEEERVPK
jgi:hypothetical protein